jgi:hypothetical protein
MVVVVAGGGGGRRDAQVHTHTRKTQEHSKRQWGKAGERKSGGERDEGVREIQMGGEPRGRG